MPRPPDDEAGTAERPGTQACASQDILIASSGYRSIDPDQAFLSTPRNYEPNGLRSFRPTLEKTHEKAADPDAAAGRHGVRQRVAQSRAAPLPSRGQLLYTTHCIKCHTTQMHWRQDRGAHDWGSLKGQVRRWQGNAGLGWNEADITEVARHLNDTIYRHPQTSDSLSLAR